jgi:hypothetical protein
MKKLLLIFNALLAINFSYSKTIPHQLKLYEIFKNTIKIVVTCNYNKFYFFFNKKYSNQAGFILNLSQDNQEIENHYIYDESLFTRVLQYLNYNIAQDVYLRLPGRPDSVAASAASYPRQYGATGRSSVLLTFPVSDKQLSHGCAITFKGEKLALGTHRFVFTAADIKMARNAPRPIK